MADTLPLSAEFPHGDEAQWRALAEKALDGAPLSKITTKTEHGVPVQPLYRAKDWAPDASGLPGAADAAPTTHTCLGISARSSRIPIRALPLTR